ncbi:MAG TPA: hypothetical protein DCX65_01535 [Spirochaetaceae bacterium]|nr:hypothetical protein [Spirochaetaceae bacterium]
MRSITNKISLAIILSTVSVGLVLGGLIYLQADRMLKTEAELHLTSILEREAEAIDAEFLRVKRLSLVLRSTVLNTFEPAQAKLDPAWMEAYKTRLCNFFTALIADFDNVSGWVLFSSSAIPGTNTVSFTFENGAFVREPEYDVIRDGYADDPWWREAVNRGENWTTPYYWEPWRAEIITYSLPIVMAGELVAVTGAELFMKPFQSRLESIRIYDSGYVMLLTGQGDQVYVPEAAAADDLWFKSWHEENREYIVTHPEGIHSGRRGSTGGGRIIAWRTLQNGWTLYARPLAGEMFGGLYLVGLITWITMLAALPVAIGIGILVSRSLTRRLAALTRAAATILDHSSALPLPPTRRFDDEIGTLIEAFRSMQQEVADALAELSLNEAKYRSLVENAEHMIYTIDVTGRFTTTNRRLEAMAGQPKSAIVGRPFHLIFPDPAAQRYWQDVFEEVLAGNAKVTRENEIKDAAGRIRTIVTVLIPVSGPDGTIAMVMGTGTDITDRLQAEKEITRLLEKENDDLTGRVAQKAAELESAMKELMEADKLASLGRLVAGVAHEMNTPLGNAITITSFLEQLFGDIAAAVHLGEITREELETELGQLREAMDSLYRSLDRTSQLVENFKQVSAAQSGERKTAINLYQLLAMTAAGYQEPLRTAGIEVTIECAADLTIETRPTAVALVLTHLMRNTVQHSFPAGWTGQLPPRLSITATAGEQAIIIEVRDNGCGMPPETLARAFEPFFTTKRVQGNAGLGLAIVFNTVTITLGGKITCESTPGQGTSFSLTIPHWAGRRRGSA